MNKVDAILTELRTSSHKMVGHTWTWLMELSQEEWILALVGGTSLGLFFLAFGCGYKR
ncbi:MAG: hypothetical protein MK161_08970 [Pirellulales bacterium]|nr:hypothetical protein [Pirellulales bacterium]